MREIARSRLPALLVGLAVFTFYLSTLAPSLVWADGGRLQIDGVTGGSVYWHFEELADADTDGWPFERLGVAAWDHPLWVMTGHGLVSLRLADPAWMLNLLSALAAASAVVILFLIICTLTVNTFGAVAGAVALAVSHIYWFHAVTAEVYALHAVFMLLLVLFALRWRFLTGRRLALIALVAGLGMANHVMLAVTAVPAAVFIGIMHWRCPHDRRPSLGGLDVVRAAAVFVVGWAPWWVQFARMSRVAGVETTVTMAAGFPWLGNRWPGPPGEWLGHAAGYLGFMVYQFTPVGLAVGAYGAVWLWRRRRAEAALLVTIFGLYAVFSANHQVADQFALHHPSFVIFAVFIGCGVSCVVAALRPSVSRWRVAAGALVMGAMALPLAVYPFVPGVLRSQGIAEADLGIPTVGVDARDGIRYFLDPNKHGDDSAARFGRSTLEGLAPQALVLTAWPDDTEPYLVMRYFQLTEDLRPDVRVDLMMFTGKPVHDSVLHIALTQRACRAIYLASDDAATYPIDELRSHFSIVTEGQLVRLLPTGDEVGACEDGESASPSLDELMRRVRQ